MVRVINGLTMAGCPWPPGRDAAAERAFATYVVNPTLRRTATLSLPHSLSHFVHVFYTPICPPIFAPATHGPTWELWLVWPRRRSEAAKAGRSPRRRDRMNALSLSASRRFAVCALGVLLAAPATAQDFRGRITGVVADSSGALLPGVTVTAESPARIQPQVAVTDQDGTYRLIALPPGVYDVTFELEGFQTLKHEGVRVVINTTLTLNTSLDVASLAETVTVSGESPIVDTTTTGVGTNFVKELLTEIPNARDVWAAMSQSAAIQVTGFDVGGSHTGTQTGYMTYGVNQQNTTRLEGINTTEGTNANAGYFDFGSFEEFQIGGAGNMADQDTPGASLNVTVKSGGDDFSGSWYSDWEGDRTISDNVPGAFRTEGERDGDGFFTREEDGLQRGNPIDRQYDINADLGGPIYRGKAWFYYSYRLNDQYKNVLNFDELARSKLTNPFTVKGTYQLNRNNQLIGYANKREKLQALRDLGQNVPVSAARFQSSRNYVYKAEWTSVLSDRLFLDVIAGTWRNFFPLRPTTESGAFAGPYVPGRLDLSTGARLDGGPHTLYQDQQREKPQFSVSLTYDKSGWIGSHNFKLGTDGRWETRTFFADQPFNHVYYDEVLNTIPSEVEFYNTPNESDNRVNAFAVYLNDNWRISDRVTLNLGLRLDRYRDFWPDQLVTPEGVPALAGTSDERLMELFSEQQVPGETVSRSTTVAPRVGLAYDLRGDGRSVLKVFWGRFYFNSAPDTVAAEANPVGRTRLRYDWTDLNGNLVLDGPAELESFLRTVAGPSGVTIDPDLDRPVSQEISAHFEREVVRGLSARASYVYKNIRDEWDVVDLGRIATYTLPIEQTDPGPDGQSGTADDGGTIALFDRAPAEENRVFTNPADNDADYHTLELGVNRRFRDRWMLLASFGYTWLEQLYGTGSDTGALSSAGNNKDYDWRPNLRRFGREQTTIWNYKIIGRYVAPWAVGISGSYKVQSGRQWGRSLNVSLPEAGSETIRVEPATANRAPNVAILDLRFDKTFTLAGGVRLTPMLDIFNLANAGTVTAFRNATASNGSFQEVTALLDPRIVRFGVRLQF
ncbi:MAG: hypothetical protein GEV06_02700 [Luteitalea sp.]|nr:hypothetical protein [Luteitalea sp.]